MKKLFLSLAAAAVLLLPISAQASEKTGFYFTPKFSVNVQHTERDSQSNYSDSTRYTLDTTQTTAGYTLAIGYDFTPKFNLPIRAELEYGYYGDISKRLISKNPSGDTNDESYNIGIKTLLANVYADLFTWNGFTPYVGAGIGIAFVKTQCECISSYTSNFWNETSNRTQKILAGQIGLGCSYAFSDTLSLDLGYRLLMIDKGNTTEFRPGSDPYSAKWPCRISEKGNTYIQQFMLGVRVTF